jgi:hypothetical protein
LAALRRCWPGSLTLTNVTLQGNTAIPMAARCTQQCFCGADACHCRWRQRFIEWRGAAAGRKQHRQHRQQPVQRQQRQRTLRHGQLQHRLSATLNDSGGSLENADTCNLVGAGSVRGVDPLLQALADDGGPSAGDGAGGGQPGAGHRRNGGRTAE